MRLNTLYLKAIGPFTDNVVDLSGGNEGLHLIIGNNESGKTSLQRAIDYILFGFPRKPHGQEYPDAFVHPAGNLLAGASITSDAGTLEFIRRRTGNTLITPDGAPLDKASLDAHIGELTRDLFQRVFNIDFSDIRRGAAAIETLESDLGNILFNADMGGGQLQTVIESLHADAVAIYNDNKTSVLKMDLKSYKSALKAKHAAESESRNIKTLRKQYDELVDQLDEIGRDIRDNYTVRDQLDRQLRAIPLIAQYASLESGLSQLDGVVSLPDAYDPAERGKYEKQLRDAIRAEKQILETLDAQGGVRDQIAAITIPEAILGHEEQIFGFSEKIGELNKLKKERAKTHADIKLNESEAERLKTALGDIPRLTKTAKKKLSSLSKKREHIRVILEEKKTNLEKLDYEISDFTKRLNALPPDQDTTRLQRILKQAREENYSKNLETINRERSALQSEADVQLRALSRHLNRTLDEVESLPVPDEIIDSFHEQYLKIQEDRRDLKKEIQSIDGDIRNKQKQITRVLKSGDIPSQDDLANARKHRNRGWELIRADWLNGSASDADIRDYLAASSLETTNVGEENDIRRGLAAAFTEAVNAADAIADTMLNESERVHKLAEYRDNLDELNKRKAHIEKALTKLDTREEIFWTDWTSKWAPAGVEHPDDPAAMEKWLQKFDKLKEKVAAIRKKTTDADAIRNKIQTFRSKLNAELERIGQTPALDTDSFPDVLQQCDDVLNQYIEIQKQRDKLQTNIDEKCHVKEKLKKEYEATLAEQEEWARDWADAITPLRLPPDADSEAAQARMEEIDDYYSNCDTLKKLRNELSDLDMEIRTFNEWVQRIVTVAAPDLDEKDSSKAAQTLIQRLRGAKRDKQTLDNLKAQEEKLQKDLDKARADKAEAEEELRIMRRIAEVDDNEHLPEVEKQSKKKKELLAELRSTKNALNSIAAEAGMNRVELISSMEGTDRAAIKAEKRSIDDKIAELETARSEKNQERGALKKQLDELEGRFNIAEADQEMLAHMESARIHMREFVTHRLAATLLSRLIEKNRQENQPNMLLRASDIFKRLTDGAYERLAAGVSEQNQKPILLAVPSDSSSSPIRAEHMSDGTRDQLFLALRIASLEHTMTQHGQAPLVIDDIIVTFDGPRSRQTLKVLAELSTRTQVIYMTHHEHLVRYAEEILTPGENLFVHPLE